MGDTRRIFVLGSTGSIGTATLDVVRHLAEIGGPRYEVAGIAAGANAALAAEQANGDDDDGEDQQEVDEAAHRGGGEVADGPQQDEQDGDGFEHGGGSGARDGGIAAFEAGCAAPFGMTVRWHTQQKRNGAPKRPVLSSRCRRVDQRCLMISSANSLHFTSVAPSIRRAKS